VVEMKGYIGQSKINIVNDSGVELDNYIWIVTTYENTLLRFDLKRRVLEYVITFKDIKSKMHSFTNIVSFGRCLYLIPGYSNYIVKYNVDTQEYKCVKLKQDIKERLYSRVCIYNSQLYIFVSGSEKIYIYDLCKDEIRCFINTVLSNIKYAYIKVIDKNAYFCNAKAETEIKMCLDDLTIDSNNGKESNYGNIFFGGNNSSFLPVGTQNVDMERKIYVAQKQKCKTYIFYFDTKDYGVIEDNNLILNRFPKELFEVNEAAEKCLYDFVLENGVICYLLPRYGNIIIKIDEDKLQFFMIEMDNSLINYFKILCEQDEIYEGYAESMGLREFFQVLLMDEPKKIKDKGINYTGRNIFLNV